MLASLPETEPNDKILLGNNLNTSNDDNQNLSLSSSASQPEQNFSGSEDQNAPNTPEREISSERLNRALESIANQATYELTNNHCKTDETKSDFTSLSINYELEILKLKKKVQQLKNDNIILSTCISNEVKENALLEDKLKSGKVEGGETLNKIYELISYKNNENIFNFFNRLNEKYNEEKSREEFIKGLEEIYVKINNLQQSSGEQNNIKVIWRWLKQLVKDLKIIDDENQNIQAQIEHISQEGESYQQYCESIFRDYGLRDIEDLKAFIHELLVRKTIDEKRVHKLKQVLMGNGGHVEN